MLLNLPYLRLQQEIRLASERELASQRTELQHAAFVGWQLRDVVMTALGAKRKPTFQQYLQSLGLGDKPRSKATALAEKGAGTKNAARVREAFRRGAVRKS